MQHRRTRWNAQALLFGPLVLLAACSGGGDTSTTTDAGEEDATATEAAADTATGADEAAGTEADAAAGTEGEASALTDVQVGLVSHNAASPGIQLYADVFTEEAESRGWSVTHVDTAGDAVAAQNQLLDWISQGFDAVVVDTVPNEGLTAAIEAASEAGVPYFSVASGEQEGVTNEVTANETESGTELTEAFVEALGGEGRIIKLNWTGLEPLQLRDQAFQDVIAGTDIEVVREVELQVPGWNEDAYNQVTNILTSDPDVQGIWQGWDDFAPDVVRAVDQAGLSDQIIVAGFDLDPAAADLLREDGAFQMTNALPIPIEAVHTVDAIETVLTGGEVEPVSYVDNCLATPDNIGDFSREDLDFWRQCYEEQGLEVTF